MATRKKPPPPQDNIQRGMDFLERFGLPTALLVAAGYFGFTLVIEPLARTYRDAINKVAETSESLEKALEENNKEDGQRVEEITRALRSLEMKIDSLSRPEK